jgi:hypothetical protein
MSLLKQTLNQIGSQAVIAKCELLQPGNNPGYVKKVV